jgi:small nuclear ribonucleoprotein (snRNP)-like protein
MSPASPSAFREHYIGATIRATTRDGRCFVGTLRCVDKQKNVVVSDAREYASLDAARADDGTDATAPQRTINMILLDAASRASCEAAAPATAGVARALGDLAL